MSVEEILRRTEEMFQREQVGYYDAEDCYEWRISYDLASALARNAGVRMPRKDETAVLLGIPIRIEYEKTNTIELWKKVG